MSLALFIQDENLEGGSEQNQSKDVSKVAVQVLIKGWEGLTCHQVPDHLKKFQCSPLLQKACLQNCTCYSMLDPQHSESKLSLDGKTGLTTQQ
jgi:hypothetical protein